MLLHLSAHRRNVVYANAFRKNNKQAEETAAAAQKCGKYCADTNVAVNEEGSKSDTFVLAGRKANCGFCDPKIRLKLDPRN
nr:hypothetical protein HmN_000110200 [Hymenolepis microstoma]